MRFKSVLLLLILILALSPALPTLTPTRAGADAGVYRITYAAGGRTLTVEVLTDDLAHFQLSAEPVPGGPIWTTPMIARTYYSGPSAPIDEGQARRGLIETPDLRIEVQLTTLCVTLTDTARSPEALLTTLCPLQDEGIPGGLSVTQEATTDLYGLGEQFLRYGETDGNWIGRQRLTASRYGNEVNRFHGGGVGNDQFPILYALGPGTLNYALFIDHLYAQQWNFTADPFTLKTRGDTLRWYVITGPNLPDLRTDYMTLTGFPPVPPKQMFGLWVSEYGFDNWNEVSEVLQSMRAANFPLDGFVLDLQWFGGIGAQGQIGSLTWDEASFPQPAKVIAGLRDVHGLGFMLIEESFVNKSLADYDQIVAADVLVRKCPEPDCDPVTMVEWWGYGGMVDWSNPAAGAWWHDHKRQPLIDMGVMAHWTDLGEPENFTASATYYGFPDQDLHAHADIHNVYNLLWSQSIYEGYMRNDVERRPFILSRSGTSGSQRFAVSMWSGDIGSNLGSLAAHMNVQMHMSLSGIDYYGADVGGFERAALEPDADEDAMYTIWLANAALLDVPLRPHTINLDNIRHTAPSLIGDVDSNLFNVRLRYELSPYLYTLAHRAYLYGEPVFPPLVYYYQDDPNVRTIGGQKMIGRDLMMATVTDYGVEEIDVYLPAGGWFDYHTHDYYASEGEWVTVPTVSAEGIFRVPLFVAANSAIPIMHVDDQTLNTLGQRLDGTTNDDLLMRVFTTGGSGFGTFVEDDGTTLMYRYSGGWQITGTALHTGEDSFTIIVQPTAHFYQGAPTERNAEIQVIAHNLPFTTIELNGEPLPELNTRAAFDAADQGYYVAPDGVIYLKSGVLPVDAYRQFDFILPAE